MHTLIACLALAPTLPLSGQQSPLGAPILVESWPLETTLDHSEMPDAPDVWLAMIAGAKRTVDLGEFYVTSAPGSQLERVLDALKAAHKRGVIIRLLVDAEFAKGERATLELLEKTSGWQIRRIDVEKRSGGVMHAKYFIVDGTDVFMGSQNFDWRALTHIQELGLRLQSAEIAGVFTDVFETDWDLAADGPASGRVKRRTDATHFPLAMGTGNERVEVTPVMSPKGWLTDESLWDLPRIVALLDGAKKSVRVQVLTYKTQHHGASFDTLDSALRRAAGRGVEVELMTSDWCKGACLVGLQSLDRLDHVAVKRVTIPAWSGGAIPYARVIHAKYLVVDGERAWVGTSNWEYDYFFGSRNLGLILLGGRAPGQLDRFFSDLWRSDYASAVDTLRNAATDR